MNPKKHPINAKKYKCSRLYPWSTHKTILIKGWRVAPHFEITAPVLFIQTSILRMKTEALKYTSIEHLNLLMS